MDCVKDEINGRIYCQHQMRNFYQVISVSISELALLFVFGSRKSAVKLINVRNDGETLEKHKHHDNTKENF